MNNLKVRDRFRGFLPVVVDLETAGVNPHRNALLEMCVVLLNYTEDGYFQPGEYYFEHIIPFENAELDKKSLEFIQVDPFQPLRFAIDEKLALKKLFTPIEKALKLTGCQKAVLVGHNAWFDLLFIKEAVKRTGVRCPFHSFTCFDTATLSGLVYGQTVLALATKAAQIEFDVNEAHSAIYDATKTAELFCALVNQWEEVKRNSPFSL